MKKDNFSPLLSLPAAVAGDSLGKLVSSPASFDKENVGEPEKIVALHFGAPLVEQRRLAVGESLADLFCLQVVEVSGSERHQWLHSITSQDMLSIEPGQSRELINLDLHGKILHWAAVWEGKESTFIICEDIDVDGFVEYIQAMIFRYNITVCKRPDITVIGQLAKSDLSIVPEGINPIFTWKDPWPGIEPGGTTYFVDEQLRPLPHPGELYQAFMHVFPVDSLMDALAKCPANTFAGFWAWEALRIAAWRPRLSIEAKMGLTAMELDWVRTAVHLRKGCYRGQETVARVINLGKPAKRIVFLDFDGANGEVPTAGTPLYYQGKLAGEVTSSALHYEDGFIGLGLVKRNLPEDALLTNFVECYLGDPGTSSVDTSANKMQASSSGKEQTSVAKNWVAKQSVVVTPIGKSANSSFERPGAGVRILPGAPRGMNSTSGLTK